MNEFWSVDELMLLLLLHRIPYLWTVNDNQSKLVLISRFRNLSGSDSSTMEATIVGKCNYKVVSKHQAMRRTSKIKHRFYLPYKWTTMLSHMKRNHKGRWAESLKAESDLSKL
uniref:Uncharacterized protein n=1 Tax=Romanomermis culicivorax TaxID=13658 RepID=A0A915HEK7_ROMCU